MSSRHRVHRRQCGRLRQHPAASYIIDSSTRITPPPRPDPTARWIHRHDTSGTSRQPAGGRIRLPRTGPGVTALPRLSALSEGTPLSPSAGTVQRCHRVSFGSGAAQLHRRLGHLDNRHLPEPRPPAGYVTVTTPVGTSATRPRAPSATRAPRGVTAVAPSRARPPVAQLSPVTGTGSPARRGRLRLGRGEHRQLHGRLGHRDTASRAGRGGRDVVHVTVTTPAGRARPDSGRRVHLRAGPGLSAAVSPVAGPTTGGTWSPSPVPTSPGPPRSTSPPRRPPTPSSRRPRSPPSLRPSRPP